MSAGASASTPSPDAPAAGRPRLTAVRFDGQALFALDQTVLPWEERELALRSAGEVAAAIKRLAIRGAPLIGVAAAYGVALELAREPTPEALERAADTLVRARPTAVNLAWAVERVRAAVRAAPADAPPDALAAAAAREARAIHAAEEAASDAMAVHGADLLAGTRRLLTHCNTGALAAPGRGTALGVVVELAARGELDHVLVTESRPLLQGARLTSYELHRLGIEHTLIVDSAAAGLLARGEAQAVIVGCDRVAANGDVANKVGTYPLALAARAADLPFVVAGPTSTIDPGCPGGAQIVIEERDGEEVRTAGGRPLALPQTRARNPAFDVTPAALVHALVTERGAAAPVNRDTVAALLRARA
ncbi:MAG TPA: S-methyl-5-thioribose-1-phosphate isomerase [Solirubrobacteraceae bacterium]|nr:S-methyl-5-thioribose-1-phosphate isomerase [Solirubrobacteraceae bacterium]